MSTLRDSHSQHSHKLASMYATRIGIIAFVAFMVMLAVSEIQKATP